MVQTAPNRLKIVLSVLICLLLGGWTLYSQVLHDIHRQQLKAAGQSTVGAITKATRHSVDMIPMGYSFQVSYADQSKEFDVSRQLFYSYVDHNDRFSAGARIPMVFLADRPDVAEPQEMLDAWFWWGGPPAHYLFGAFFLLCSVLVMVKLHKQARGGGVSPRQVT